jgi:hypothetical protein
MQNVVDNPRNSSSWIGENDYVSICGEKKESVIHVRRLYYKALYGLELFNGVRNDMMLYGLIENRREFYNTRLVATNLMFKIERKIDDLYPSNLEEEQAKYVERCREEEDIICERDEMTEKWNLIVTCRWSKQIKLITKEAKTRRLMKDSRSVSIKNFDDSRVRKNIKEFKEKTRKFATLVEIERENDKKFWEEVIDRWYINYYKLK